VAASGAYLVATGTDYIVSEPHALTGSIGVVMTFTSMGGLFEKLGVNMTAITSGQYKDTGSPARNLNPDEIRMMQAIVDEVFQDFKSAVIQNRGKRLNLQKFNEVADGRIMTGKQAKEIGLVDALGDKNDALVKAAKLGGMDAENPEDVRVCPVEVYPRETSLISLNSFVSSVNEKFQSVGLYLR
jgi:protease-4